MSTTTTNSLPNAINPPSPSTPSLTSTTPSTFSPTLPHSPETTRQIAEARTFLEASISNIGSCLDSSLKSRAQNLHANSAQLEKQQKDVIKATEGLRKENEKLGKVLKEGGKKVKELGNVQNWAEMLERDFLVLRETVRLANGGSESGSGSQTGSGSWESGSEGSLGDEEMGDGVGQSDAITGVRIEESSDVGRVPQITDIAEAAGGSRDFITGTNGVKISELPALDQSVQDGVNPGDRMDMEGDSSDHEQPSVVAHTEANLLHVGKGVEDTYTAYQPIVGAETKPLYQVDGEGDTQMEDPIPESKGKGRELVATFVPTLNHLASQAISEDMGQGTQEEVFNLATIIASPEAGIQASSLSSTENDLVLEDKRKGKNIEVISDLLQEAIEEDILPSKIGVVKADNGEKRETLFDSVLQVTLQETTIRLSSGIVPEEKGKSTEIEILSGSAAPLTTLQEEAFENSLLVDDATNSNIKGKESISDQTTTATKEPIQILDH